MKSIVPYTKEIKFDSKLAEICTISLEHEINVLENEIEGNFIISGEYKTHEVSINKEKFNYKLPFSIDVTDSIIKESIDFEITDFTYDIIDDSILKIDIEFMVSAEEEKVKEENLLDREIMLDEINNFLLDKEEEEEIIEEIVEEKNIPVEEIKEEKIIIEESPISENDRIDQESAELILDSAGGKDDEYTTYYIHVVKSGDTLDSIVSMYQADLSILKQYNSLDNISMGDKIIIPSIDE